MDKTLTDFLNGGADIKDAVYDISEAVSLPENSLLLVPSSMHKGNIADLIQNKKSSEKLTKAIELLEKDFEPDFIMIDTHPGLNDEFLVMSSKTDVLLNIVRPDNQDYQGLGVSSEVSKKLKLKSYVVLNKVHKKIDRDIKKQVEKAFKVQVAGMLPYSEDIMLSQSQFIMSDKDPDNIFSRSIYGIAETVFGVKPKGHLEIMHDLLLDLSEGKTLLQCKAHIPPSKCDSYVNKLIDEGFISKEKGKFIMEEKGTKFLKKYNSIKKFVDNFRI